LPHYEYYLKMQIRSKGHDLLSKFSESLNIFGTAEATNFKSIAQFEFSEYHLKG